MIDKEVARTFDRRSALFLTGGAVLTSMLVMRMLQMQVFNYQDYKKKSENNSLRIQMDLPRRGKILGAGDQVITRDADVYRIYIIPEEIPDIDALIATLTADLRLRPKTVKRIRATIKKQPRFSPVLVSDKLDWKTLAVLQAKNLPGVHIRNGFARHYELGPAGAQIFGYVGAATKPMAGAPFYTTGITGLERRFNDTLSGIPGQTVMITNALGRVTGEDKSQNIAPTPGGDVHTTIRMDVQKALYDALMLHRSGCGVVLDITNGDILAMASAPSFDPSAFGDDDGDEYIAALRRDMGKPFMNKAIEGLYPPGSTFKIVVALAALEAGATTATEKISCPGHWVYGDRQYHCWKRAGHGPMDLADALKHSCDIYFYQMALRIGIDAIRAMAVKLGLGEKYMDDVLSREMPGVIPDRRWKEKQVGHRWVHGDTIISGIGQGFILTNCLQLAVMTARVASNRRVVPRLIQGPAPTFEKLNLQPKNIRTVMQGMDMVTQSGGTAAGHAINVGGNRMGGKTGTSQVRNISRAERESGVLTNEQLKWNMRDHGLFIAYAPTKNPRYAVCVITEHSGGSGAAASTAAAALRQVLGDK
ncbi:penicillin-binding protein 2 [bacterium]|nr:penicillin-binding protein 2 [bacterium]